HVRPISDPENDFVSVAERLIGAAYVWGGKTFAGIDCSGLIQTALQACNIECPRDTAEQESFLGFPVADRPLQRGDLIFWNGHAGVMRDGRTLLHASAIQMEVVAEPLVSAIERIEPVSGPIVSMKRLGIPPPVIPDWRGDFL